MTSGRFKILLLAAVLYTEVLCQISGSLPTWYLRKMWQKFLLLYNTYIRITLSSGKQEVDKRQIPNSLTRYSSIYWSSVRNIRKLAYMVPEKNVTENFLYYAYKFRQTGSWQPADMKLCYTIQFIILMLCTKYHEASLHGSWEKCDRNFCDADNAGDTITTPFFLFFKDKMV